jgi:hypothetical protein
MLNCKRRKVLRNLTTQQSVVDPLPTDGSKMFILGAPTGGMMVWRAAGEVNEEGSYTLAFPFPKFNFKHRSIMLLTHE